MDRYRNDEYSEGTWVYINGELYHAGVKGMHWYQHLPGTDWWKNVGTAFKYSYNKYMTDNSKPQKTTYTDKNGRDRAVTVTPKPSKVRAALAGAGAAAKMIGGRAHGYLYNKSRYYGNKIKNSKVGQGISKLWNSAKGYSEQQIAKFKESAQNHYNSVRSNVDKFLSDQQVRAGKNYHASRKVKGSDDINYLQNLVDNQYQKSIDAYKDKSSSGFNRFLQSTLSNIVTSAATYLDKIGMDDEAYRFLNKFMSEKVNKRPKSSPEYSKHANPDKQINMPDLDNLSPVEYNNIMRKIKNT